MAYIANLLLFQLGWLACVMSAAKQQSWIGLLLVILIIGFHLFRATTRSLEIRLIALVMLIGVCWDSLLVATGILTYQHGLLHSQLAPYWIIAMWALFATTLNLSLGWLKGRPLIASLFGALGGPLSYYLGVELGAVEMPNETIALLTLAIGWACIMPILSLLSVRFNGYQRKGAV